MATKTATAPKGASTIRCTDEYVYFYSDKSPFSNWAITPNITYDGHKFTSSEALFMYLKAIVFRDEEMAQAIIPLAPDAAKRCGRKIRNFDEQVWARERENAMYLALRAKLAASDDFRNALLAEEYRGKSFVEASPYDAIWGIKQSVAQAYKGAEWKGLNLLGKLLTELRDEALGLAEPSQRVITPISSDQIKPEPKPRAKRATTKSSYSTDGVMVYSILGGMIGDIVGSSREGYGSNAPAAQKLLTSQSFFTDDTTLMVAVADWLNNKDKSTLKDILLRWSEIYPFVGYGGLYKKFVETQQAQPSNGNGGAMRVAPCAIYAKSLDEALTLAEQQCKVSHTSEIAVNGAKAVAAAIYIARDGRINAKSAEEVKGEVKSFVEEQFGYDLSKSLDEIRANSLELAHKRDIYRNTGEATDSYINMSNASLSCPMAIMAFLMGNSFEESIRYALAMLGDSDTIACMAGSISAQYYGIPQKLADEALIYLPLEMIEVLNTFEQSSFPHTRIAPPVITRWRAEGEIVVYGTGENENENGGYEVTPSRYNRYPRKGYPIPTIGKSLEEIGSSIATLIEYAKQNPELRFHVRKVGYDKAGYTVEQIAPLFKGAKDLSNILLPQKMLAELKW